MEEDITRKYARDLRDALLRNFEFVKRRTVKDIALDAPNPPELETIIDEHFTRFLLELVP